MTSTAKTIQGKDRLVTDGPYAETKEVIEGYYIVSAEKMGDVLEIAQDYPDYHLGGNVEVREILAFDR